jgi:hypothetical protein
MCDNAECLYAIMLSVIMLSVFMFSVIVLSVIMFCRIVLRVIIATVMEQCVFFIFIVYRGHHRKGVTIYSAT